MSAARRSRPRRVLVGLATSLGVLVFVFLAGELGVRWHVEEGLLPALASFVDPDAAPPAVREPGADQSFIQDAEFGFVLNSALPTINALGVRHDELAIPKPAGLRRIVLIGDSVAFDPGGFADELGARLTEASGGALEFVNAAVPGYTTHQERLFLEKRLLDLEPDLVLLQYCLNDNHRFLHRVTVTGDRLFTPEAKRALLPEGHDVLTRFARWSYLLVEIRRRAWARRIRSESPWPWEGREDFGPAWRASTWPALEAELGGACDAARARGARFAVVAVPFEPQLLPELLERDRDQVLFPQARLRAFCESRAIPLLDLFAAFSAAGPGDRLYKDGVHLAPRGHALAAEECRRFLVEQGLVPGG